MLADLYWIWDIPQRGSELGIRRRYAHSRAFVEGEHEHYLPDEPAAVDPDVGGTSVRTPTLRISARLAVSTVRMSVGACGVEKLDRLMGKRRSTRMLKVFAFG